MSPLSQPFPFDDINTWTGSNTFLDTGGDPGFRTGSIAGGAAIELSNGGGIFFRGGGGAGFAGNKIALLGGNGTTIPVIQLPDIGNGTIALSNAAQTITGKWTIGAGVDDTICLALDSYTAGGSTNDFLTINDTASITSSGFTMTLALATAGLTASRRVSIPDSTGQIVLTASTDNLQNKTLVPVGGIRCAKTTAAGIKFQNGSSITQYALLNFETLTASRVVEFRDVAGTVLMETAFVSYEDDGLFYEDEAVFYP